MTILQNALTLVIIFLVAAVLATATPWTCSAGAGGIYVGGVLVHGCAQVKR